jgi:S-adenosylmethionine-diacylgycerolhomoserine-N-methlytransferase
VSLAGDLRVLGQLVAAPFRSRDGDHGARMEAFYAAQAEHYDDFRRRLLHGREAMMGALDLAPGAVLVDMGGGTGANLEFLPPETLAALGHVYVVDLSESLLAMARARAERHGWTNVSAVHGDALAFDPGVPVDAVTFSYSLTMIPDWIGALDHARSLLARRGGRLGVVDFYVSRRWPDRGARHGWLGRTLWPAWFCLDDVFLNADLLPRLATLSHEVHRHEGLGSVPYLPFRAPYFWFVGDVAAEGEDAGPASAGDG